MSDKIDKFDKFDKALKRIPLASEFKSVGSYKHWKSIVTTMAKEYEIPEATMLTAINARVADKVAERLYSREFLTLEEFWKYMDDAFGDTHDTTRTEAYHILNHPPPSVKDIEQYFAHFDEYLGRLPGAFLNEADKILIFTGPLNPVLVQAMLTSNPKTLEETKKIARTHSIMMKGEIFRKDITRTSPKGEANETGANSDGTPNETVTIGNHLVNTDTNNIRCYYCHKRGHTQRDCRSKQRNSSLYNGSNYHGKSRYNRRINPKSQRKFPKQFTDIRDEPKN